MCSIKWGLLIVAVIAGLVGFGYTVAYQTLWQAGCGLALTATIAAFACESREQCSH